MKLEESLGWRFSLYPAGSISCFPTLRRPPLSHWPWHSIFWVKGLLWRGQEKVFPHSHGCPLPISLCFLGFLQLATDTENPSNQPCWGKKGSYCGRHRNWNIDHLQEPRRFLLLLKCMLHTNAPYSLSLFPSVSATSSSCMAALFSLSRLAPLLLHEGGRGRSQLNSHISLKFKKLAGNWSPMWETVG